MKPKSVLALVAGIAAVLVCTLFVTLAILNSRFAARKRARTGEVVGVVTSATEEYNSYANQNLRINYRYVVAGNEYTGQTLKGTDISWKQFARGKSAKVCYDPAQPSDSMIWPLDHVCSQ